MKTILKLLLGGVVASVLLCIAIAVGGFWFFFTAVDSSAQTQSFVVVKGDTVTSIAQKLEAANILRSPLSLKILYRIAGEDTAIQPGTYKLSAAMTPQELLQTLLSDTQDVWVTLKEGLRVEEMADVLDDALEDTFDPEVFITLSKPQEGKLFPDTYLLPRESTAQSVFALLTSTFESRYTKAVTASGEGTLSKKDTIILASLVEREGRGEKDSRIVAGILKNRLELGMPLQVDATLQYASGFDLEKQTWWGVPRASDKESVSEFNTYKNAGLPPSPICNPGLVSLQAALQPEESEYLYYIHDTTGIPHYARTYPEHQANIEKYLR